MESSVLLETPQASKAKTGERIAKKAKTHSTQTVQYLPCVFVIACIKTERAVQCLYGAIPLA